MWYMVISITLLIIIGLVVNIIEVRNIISNYNFTKEYYGKLTILFSNILNTKKFNNKDYVWLMSNSDKMQMILGETGIVTYKQFNMLYKNIPILLNVLNEIPSSINDSYLIDNQSFSWCQNAFLRKIGILNEYIDNAPKRLLNPLTNLTDGIKWILGIPINILYSIGLISYDSKNKIKNNIMFKLFSGIISLLTLLSTIMSVTLGWNEFLEIIKGLLNIK